MSPEIFLGTILSVYVTKFVRPFEINIQLNSIFAHDYGTAHPSSRTSESGLYLEVSPVRLCIPARTDESSYFH